MKVYIASGFFNPEQLKDVEDIKKVLTGLNILYFSPKDDNLAKPDDGDLDLLRVFKKNIEEIEKCDLIIVNTRSKDMGSIFEAGYAYTKVPILYYFTELKKYGNFNLMLAKSGIGVCDSPEDLDYFLTQFSFDRSYQRLYRKKIE